MRTKRIKNKLRRIAVFTLLFFVFEVVPVPFWIPWVPAEIYSHIAGKVTDAQTGEAVANLDVIAVKSGDTTGQTFSAKTTSKGNYDICCAPPGMYQLLIDPQSPYIREGPHKEVTVVRGRNVINANFAVQKGSSVSGTIFDSDGVTPTKVSIVLADQIHETEEDLTYFFALDKGQHKLTGLKPNKTYRLYANAPNQASVYQDVQTTSTGQVIGNVNLTLGHPATKISGIVTSNGVPIKDAEVRVISDKISGYATTDEQGRYVISGLLEGKYAFTVIAPNFEPFGELGIQVQSQQEAVRNVSLLPASAAEGKTDPVPSQKRIGSNRQGPFWMASASAVTPAFAYTFFWEQSKLLQLEIAVAGVALAVGTSAKQKIQLFNAAQQVSAALFNAGIYVGVTVSDIAQTICRATTKNDGDFTISRTTSRTRYGDSCDILASFCSLTCGALYINDPRNLFRCETACAKDRQFCKKIGGVWPQGPFSESLPYLEGFPPP